MKNARHALTLALAAGLVWVLRWLLPLLVALGQNAQTG